VVRRDHSLPEVLVGAGAGIFHARPRGELEESQPADILVVIDRRGVQESGHAIGISVWGQNDPGSVEVVNVALLRPFGRVGFRSWQPRLDTLNAVKDQIELYIETARRPAAFPLADWHAASFHI
jgi:hypothetical protein